MAQMKKQKKTRKRVKVVAFLDKNNQRHADTLELIERLKQSRKRDESFTSTFVDGLALMADLRGGKMDVLMQLFPWVLTAIEQEVQLRIAEQQGTISGMDAFLKRIEQMFQNQMQNASLAPITLPDEPIREVIQPVSDPSRNPVWENQISIAGMRGTYSHLSREVIEYGVERGLISKNELKSPVPTAAFAEVEIAIPDV